MPSLGHIQIIIVTTLILGGHYLVKRGLLEPKYCNMKKNSWSDNPDGCEVIDTQVINTA